MNKKKTKVLIDVSDIVSKNNFNLSNKSKESLNEITCYIYNNGPLPTVNAVKEYQQISPILTNEIINIVEKKYLEARLKELKKENRARLLNVVFLFLPIIFSTLAIVLIYRNNGIFGFFLFILQVIILFFSIFRKLPMFNT